MIRLQAEVTSKLDDTVEGLRAALQNAIELEHSTIPPYLYALYSLKPGANKEIAGIIRSVVLEEMLHMSLACNVLNAVGGQPLIDSPKFIPEYPTHLPGAVQDKLIVGLQAFSLQLLSDVFMVIEEPEVPLEYPVVPPPQEMFAASIEAKPPMTIGEFYNAIVDQIRGLGPVIFTGDPKLQLTATFNRVPLFPVLDEPSAIKALELIVDQGEGTKTSPIDVDKEPAHYYRYAEICKGYKLIRNPAPLPGTPPYIYGGAPVPFAPQDVWPALTNPQADSYPPGSAADIGNKAFNRAYTVLLKTLHAVFNGAPDRIATALLNMQALHQQAGYLMSLPFGAGTAGPSFDYDVTPAQKGNE
jgi:Ferritin-like